MDSSDFQRAIQDGVAAELERRAMLQEVAQQYGIPDGLVPRLRGTNRAELEADAQDLAAGIAVRSGGQPGRSPVTVDELMAHMRGYRPGDKIGPAKDPNVHLRKGGGVAI